MRKLTPKEAASLCAILGTLAGGCAHAATQCRVDPTLNGCRLQTVVITNKVPGSITIPNQPTPTIYVPPGVIGVVGGFTPPNVTANGGTIGTYSSSTNSHCPQSGGKPAIDTAGIQSYIQQQEGLDPLVQAMSYKAFKYNFTNETGYLPGEKQNPNCISNCIYIPVPTSGLTVWGVDGGQNTVKGLEANATPETLPVLQALFATGMPLWKMFGHLNTSPTCRRDNDCEMIYPTGQGVLNALEYFTTAGTSVSGIPRGTGTPTNPNPLTAVPSLGVSATQGALDIFQAGYNQDITNMFLVELAGSATAPFSEWPGSAQAAFADFAWWNGGGNLSVTAMSYALNGDFGALGAYMGSFGTQGAKDAIVLDDDLLEGKVPYVVKGVLCG